MRSYLRSIKVSGSWHPKTFIRPSSVASIWMAMALKMMMSVVVLMAQAKGHESGHEPPSHAGCFVSNGTTMLAVPFLQAELVGLGFDFGWISNLYMEGFVGKIPPKRCGLAAKHISATPTTENAEYFQGKKVTN